MSAVVTGAYSGAVTGDDGELDFGNFAEVQVFFQHTNQPLAVVWGDGTEVGRQ